ncbi:MAG TPA: hypothetical protein VG890_07800 [Puia sp.]|nr:hypothetical protein [Puia sp.]
MSIEIADLTRDELEKLAIEHQMQPVLRAQNPYIASGPKYEILAGVQPNGLYHVQLLDKKEVQESVERTIRIFKEYAANPDQSDDDF